MESPLSSRLSGEKKVNKPSLCKMVFKCQEDSFLKEYEARVVSCEPATYSIDGIVNPINGFNVILDETILFPEGGGQPCDFGTLNGKPVKNVVRKGSEAVHFVESSTPFAVGEVVKETVDWDRRLDHMQQHSGQHLISALIEDKYNYDTKSWWLGSETSYVELGTKDISKDQLICIEHLANKYICEGRKVSVEVSSSVNELQVLRPTRGLPSDHVGPVRVIVIDGIDSNMCCGTHVTNLSQLQAVKLLHIEKTKGKVLVHFLVGNRVIKKLEECYLREQQLTSLLKGAPSSHVELVQKIQSTTKTAQKTFQKLLKEVAKFEADRVAAQDPLPKYYSLHRQDGIEPDFITTFLRHAPTGLFYFLTVSDATGKGHMVLRGDEEVIRKFSTVFTELLNGKGNGKGGNYQAKVNNVSTVADCTAKLKEHFCQ